jgi:hypothetical protein
MGFWAKKVLIRRVWYRKDREVMGLETINEVEVWIWSKIGIRLKGRDIDRYLVFRHFC